MGLRHEKKFSWTNFIEWAKRSGYSDKELIDLKILNKKGKPINTKKNFTRAADLYTQKIGTIRNFTTEYGYWHEGKGPNKKVFGPKTKRVGGVSQVYLDLKDLKSTKNTLSKGVLSLAKKRREDALSKQTSPFLEAIYKTKSRKEFIKQLQKRFLRPIEDHHIRPRELLEPFFEGLNDSEAKKLTEWLIEGEFPIGNVLANLQDLDHDLHQYAEDSLHYKLKDLGIDVRPFKKDEWLKGKATNFLDDGRVLGDVDGQVVDTGKISKHKFLNPELPPDYPVTKATIAKLPYVGQMDDGTFGAMRKQALRDYLELIEGPLLEETSKVLEIQDARRLALDPKYLAKNKTQWMDHFKTQAAQSADDLFAQQDLRMVTKDLPAEELEKLRRLGGLSDDTLGSVSNIRKFLGVARKSPLRFALPIAGIALATMHNQARAAEYEEDPTKLNMIQHKMSQVELGLEGFDTFTGGAGGLFTFLPSLALWAGDSAIDHYEKKQEEKIQIQEAQMSQLGEVEKDSNVNNFIGTFHGI